MRKLMIIGAAAAALLAAAAGCGGSSGGGGGLPAHPSGAQVAHQIGATGYRQTLPTPAFVQEEGSAKLGGDDVTIDVFGSADQEKMALKLVSLAGGFVVHGNGWSVVCDRHSTVTKVMHAIGGTEG